MEHRDIQGKIMQQIWEQIQAQPYYSRNNSPAPLPMRVHHRYLNTHEMRDAEIGVLFWTSGVPNPTMVDPSPSSRNRYVAFPDPAVDVLIVTTPAVRSDK